MNKSLIGALVVAMALLPSFASATTTAYDVPIGDTKVYFVPGSLGTTPTLQQSVGSASIVSSVFLVNQWRVEVMCHEDSPDDCEGDIVS